MRLLQKVKVRNLLAPLRKFVSLKFGIFVLLVVLTTLAFKQGTRSDISISVGDRWQKETLIASSEFPIYKSEDSLRVQKRRVRDQIEPVFYTFPGARKQTRAAADSISKSLEQILDAYTTYLVGAIRDTLAAGNTPGAVSLSETTIEDSLQFIALRQQASIRLSDTVWRLLGWDYARRSAEFPTASSVMSSTPPLFERILDAIASRSQRLQLQGVLDIPADSIRTSYLIVRDTLEQTFDRRATSGIVGQYEARQRILVWLEETVLSEESRFTSTAITQFIEAIFTPSLMYQSGPTLQRQQEAEALILPVRGMVAEGEEIVRSGERITPEIKQKLDSLERESELPESQGGLLQVIGQILLSLTTIGIFALFLRNARPQVFSSNISVILLAVLYSGTVITFGAVIRLAPVEFMYAVPVVIVSVLLTVIFDSRLALFGTLALALIGGFLLNSDFIYTWATLISGAVAIFSARDLRNRGQLFLTAAYAFVGYALALSTAWLYEGGGWAQLQEDLLFAGISSFLLVTSYPFLWILERVFDITTDLRLLELSDTNHPLLGKLMQSAPGTFNHSIQVSSLAGSVADAVGANTLLTRVGALYHDVGKVTAPKYFIENQTSGTSNPHDELPPEESAEIIINHVTKGLKLGERYRLPARVLHLVASHHGTTRTEYFYQQALRRSKITGEDLNEDKFRYPGPRPDSKEAGILMLTDSVEAASRTMKDVTGEKLQNLIDNLISQKVSTGQLDDTGLTFRDIAYIKKALLEQLSAIHHVRIDYPDVSES